MKIEESFREKMLDVVKKAKFNLKDDGILVKDVKGVAKSEAKQVIDEHIVASYLLGRSSANMELGKEDDLSLGQEDLKPLASLKQEFVADFDNILKDMIKMKED